jgi:hypothetical protein
MRWTDPGSTAHRPPRPARGGHRRADWLVARDEPVRVMPSGPRGQDCATGVADEYGPKSPDSHRVVWGLISRPPGPRRAFLRFPVCPPGSFPSPASLWFPYIRRSRFVPFGRRPVPVSRRFPRVPFHLSGLYCSAATGRFRRRLVPGDKDKGHQDCSGPARLGRHAGVDAAASRDSPRGQRRIGAGPPPGALSADGGRCVSISHG